MYYLLDHIHFCSLGRILVFMDTHTDRYFSLPEAASSAFAELREPLPGAGLSPEARSLAARLEKAGVLSQDSRKGRLPIEASNVTFNGSLLDQPQDAFAHANAGDVILFFASVTALLPLNRKHDFLRALLPRLSRWKAKAAPSGEQHPRALEQAQKFWRLAPLFISSRDACLYRSALLVRYLSLQNIPSQLHIGARTAPFSAHCWVSTNGFVLNEHLETVNEFRPILTI